MPAKLAPLTTKVKTPKSPPAPSPQRWSNKEAMLFARRQGWNHKDSKALRRIARDLGLSLPPETVNCAILRGIACVLHAGGGL